MTRDIRSAAVSAALAVSMSACSLVGEVETGAEKVALASVSEAADCLDNLSGKEPSHQDCALDQADLDGLADGTAAAASALLDTNLGALDSVASLLGYDLDDGVRSALESLYEHLAADAATGLHNLAGDSSE